MTTEETKVVNAEETTKTEEVAAALEPVKVEESAPDKAEEETTTSPSKTEAAEEPVVAEEETSKEVEKAAEGEAKERNGPLKVLATIKGKLASPRKGDKKEEAVVEKQEQQPTSPNSKEKVLDKIVGIFKKDECHCKCGGAAIEDKVAKVDGETAAAETPAVEEPIAAVEEEAAKPTEEKKEDKSKGVQLYGQIVKALTPRKAIGKQSNASSVESQVDSPKAAEVDNTETAPTEEAAVESESSDKAKKEAEHEPTSPGKFTAIKRKATALVHSLEEKVCKDKDPKEDAKSKAKEEDKAEEKKPEELAAEAPVEAAGTEAVPAPVEEQAETETPAEQEQGKAESKKETKKEIVGHFIDGVKAKIQVVLSKDPDKEATKAKEESVAAAPAADGSTEAEKVREEPQANGDKKKEVFPVNELKYEDDKKTASEKTPTGEAAAPQEQVSQKWKNRMSGLFKPKKAAAEETAETPASSSVPAAAEAATTTEAAATPKETTEVTAAEPAPAVADELAESAAKDCAIRLAQLYMQSPAAAETTKQEEKAATASVD